MTTWIALQSQVVASDSQMHALPSKDILLTVPKLMKQMQTAESDCPTVCSRQNQFSINLVASYVIVIEMTIYWVIMRFWHYHLMQRPNCKKPIPICYVVNPSVVWIATMKRWSIWFILRKTPSDSELHLNQDLNFRRATTESLLLLFFLCLLFLCLLFSSSFFLSLYVFKWWYLFLSLSLSHSLSFPSSVYLWNLP